ncbi:hypothetical protein GGR50DRAFT_665387 [Xylaria sp. CBS 124048]|nr:hypothetical protein GGR50DRAFT_665387 [Xylaria sp. CBS 124048]
MPAITHKRILLTGFVSNVALPPDFRERFGSPEEIKARLATDHYRIERAGITAIFYQFDPLEQNKSLEGFESILQDGKYDAIGIGAGTRLHPDHTAFFETIVNTCGTIVPGVPLLFNDGPGGSAETLERVFKISIP